MRAFRYILKKIVEEFINLSNSKPATKPALKDKKLDSSSGPENTSDGSPDPIHIFTLLST